MIKFILTIITLYVCAFNCPQMLTEDNTLAIYSSSTAPTNNL